VAAGAIGFEELLALFYIGGAQGAKAKTEREGKGSNVYDSRKPAYHKAIGWEYDGRQKINKSKPKTHVKET
jgi:hypothetical protein